MRSIKKYISSILAPIPLPIQGMWLAHLPLRMYWHGTHEPETTQYFKRIIQKDWVCVDVGTFAGYYTVLFSKQARAVFGFEPNVRQYRWTQDNVVRNRGTNVKLFNKALAADNGPRKFYTTAHGGTDSLHAFDGSQVTLIDAVRMDDIIQGQVDLVKIDAEGADMEVLAGMERIIRENPHIRITVEFSPRYNASQGMTAEECIQTIQQFGLTVQWLDKGGIVSNDLQALTHIQGGHVNLLCTALAT